jgi:hypothetical protein
MFEARIARGIGVLDRHLPGWRERVDPDRLDMQCGLFDRAATGHDERRCGCVLSQLDADPDSHTTGDYYHQLDVVHSAADAGGRDPDRWAAEHGFDLDVGRYAYATDADEGAAYRQLTAEWRQALTAGQDAGSAAGGWSA